MQKIAFIMDPFERLVRYRDSTLMMIEAALAQHMQVYFFEPQDLFLENNQAHAHVTPVLFCDIKLGEQPHQTWYRHGETTKMALNQLDAIVIRKDPPFNIDYVFLTYLLDRATHEGVRVVNSPQAIRNLNEKMVIFRFPDCIAPTLVSAHKEDLRKFWNQQGEIVLKPLDGLGGQGIFHLKAGDTNFTTIVETLTHHGKRHIMAQRYLPEARQGDKRIILLHGEAVPTALARIPREGEARANLASGGLFKPQPLTKRDRWLCEQISSFLVENDILFAGLDVIGDYITEINLTSPGCMRELSEATGQNLAERFLAGLGL
jgi:glutathione synthase